MHSKLMSHRFDPPGGWLWKCRFSLEELKKIYYKLFGYNWFELNADRPFKSIETFNAGKDGLYGAVRLEDGGCKYLESCTIEELDWFLFIGASFGKAGPSWSWKWRMANPLLGKFSREEAMVALDLLPEKFSSELLADESMSYVNSRQ